jgi:hypothetical protein
MLFEFNHYGVWFNPFWNDNLNGLVKFSSDKKFEYYLKGWNYLHSMKTEQNKVLLSQND